MPPLTCYWFWGNLYYRATTRKIPRESLELLIRVNDFKTVIDLTRTPDMRVADYASLIDIYVPQGKGRRADICALKAAANVVYEAAVAGNVLVVSYAGKERAPAVCAMAAREAGVSANLLRKRAEHAANMPILRIPFFRKVAGL